MQSFTTFAKREGDQWASLCLELDVASCGKTKDEAFESLRNASVAYIEFMLSEGREDDIYRPVPMSELKSFLFLDHGAKEQNIDAIAMELECA